MIVKFEKGVWGRATETDVNKVEFRICAPRHALTPARLLPTTCCDCHCDLVFDPEQGPQTLKHICIECLLVRVEPKH